MAELMFGLGQTKKKKDTEAKIKQTKDQLKDVKITDTVETSARKEQFDRDKGYAATARQTKKDLKDVKITESVETNARKEQFDRDKDYAATARQTKKDLKDVKITDTVEGDVRKEQHTREQKWKETGRDNLKKNNQFDMVSVESVFRRLPPVSQVIRLVFSLISVSSGEISVWRWRRSTSSR